MSERNDSGITRRDIFRLTVVSGAAAAGAACSTIVPPPPRRRRDYVEKRVATVCGACPAGCGISVRLADGNAVHIEGLPGHPLNDGGMCPRGIAEIQNLYHPERLRGPRERAEGRLQPLTWDAALRSLADRLHGAKVVIGVGAVPESERLLIDRIAAEIGAHVVAVELPHGALPREAFQEVFGSDDYEFDLPNADMVLSLGWDWLQHSPSPVEAQRAFASIRRGHERRGRLVTAAPRLSVTASKSDAWIPVPLEGGPELFGLAVANALLARGGSNVEARYSTFATFALQRRFAPEPVARALAIKPAVIENVAKDFLAHSRPLVVADRTSPACQFVAMGLNVLLGAVGRPGGVVRRGASVLPAAFRPRSAPSRSDVFPKTEGKPVILLWRANPAFLSSPSSGWTRGLAQAGFVASVTQFEDESASTANLLLPASTPLEARQLAWGSTMSGTGFVAAGPAAVKPLHDTIEGPELLLRLAKAAGVELPWSSSADYLGALASSLNAQQLLTKGGFARVDAQAQTVPAVRPFPETVARTLESLADHVQTAGRPEYPLALDLHVPLPFRAGDGAHLPYLHGISGPGGREVWSTLVELHPDAARRAGVADGSRVWVESPHGRILATALVREGIRPDAVALPLGLGRRALGHWAKDRGANPLQLAGEDRVTYVRLRRA